MIIYFLWEISIPDWCFLSSFLSSFENSASRRRNSDSNTCSKRVFWGRRRRYMKIPSGVRKSTSKILRTWNIIECVLLVISRTTHTTRQNQTTKKYMMTLRNKISGFIHAMMLRGRFIELIIDKCRWRQPPLNDFFGKTLYSLYFLLQWDFNEVKKSPHHPPRTHHIFSISCFLIPRSGDFFYPFFYGKSCKTHSWRRESCTNSLRRNKPYKTNNEWRKGLS